MCMKLGWKIGDTRPGARPWDRLYTTYEGAARAAKRRGPGWTVIGLACACPVPGPNDAQGWDEYRRRHGYSGSHH